MSILIDKSTRVMTQGITGKTGMFHTQTSRAYANGKACFVAGVNPKKAGESFEGIPIFGTVKDAKAQTGANVSVIYVPPPFAAAAIDEAVAADLDLVICITEGIPVRDMIRTKHRMQGTRTLLVGPNCPGVITPDELRTCLEGDKFVDDIRQDISHAESAGVQGGQASSWGQKRAVKV